MKARWVGVSAIGASVLLSAAAGRGEERARAGGGERKELSGVVIKSEANTLYLEHMGAVVPVEIGRDTRFSGIRSADDLAEGQKVRASFTVKEETKNVADSISLGAPPSATRKAPEPATVEHEDYGG